MLDYLKRFWNFLKADSWQSWIVSLLLTFLFIKFIFFPFLSFALQTPLPLVVVESCSMYHGANFPGWWEQNKAWYESQGISQEDFIDFPFKNGLNKGDIIIVTGRKTNSLGNVIIFNANYTYPLIHRIIEQNPLGTKGDNNGGQLDAEKRINSNQVVGRALVRIPALGWVKLIFFEGLKDQSQRGFCR